MKNDTCGGCETCRSLGLLFARLPLGLSLAYTGYHKIHDIGVDQFASMSADRVPGFMPPAFGSYYLHAVPYAEVTLGALLVVGLLSRVSGLLASLMLLSFAIAVTGFRDYSGALPFQAPVVYGCFALVTLFAGPGKVSLDGLLFRGRRRAVTPRDVD